MSEICPECLEKLLDTQNVRKRYIISKEWDLCEECGQFGPVVEQIKRRYALVEQARELAENLVWLFSGQSP